MKPTQEQLALNVELREQYGEALAGRAEQFSGLTLCILALATDELSEDERRATYTRASEHLDKLIRSLMPQADIARMVECAHRLDAALEQWRLDEIEAREGEATNPHWLGRGGADGPGFTVASNTFMEEMRRQWERLRKGNA